ncbi:MAG: FAD binding domain-containing protein [Bacteroidota bacterium]
MSTVSHKIKYFTPETISEAIELSVNNKDASFISGGTDVMANKQLGLLESRSLIDLGNIEELKGMKVHGEYYTIGAAVVLSDIIANTYIVNNFKIIADAAKSVASPLIRNQATIGGNILCENRCIYYNQSELWREAAGYCLKCGGNICIATGGKKTCLSKFVSDIAPALICLNAKVILVSKGKEDIIPVADLYSGGGLASKKFNNHILKSILLPINIQHKSTFKKLRQRKTLEFTSLTMAVSAYDDGMIIIALSGVAPNPVVLLTHTNETIDNIYNELNKKSKIINNDFFDRKYRQTILKTYLSDSLSELKS